MENEVIWGWMELSRIPHGRLEMKYEKLSLFDFHISGKSVIIILSITTGR